MLLPAMQNKPKNKKGLSMVIGYVLLMAISITLSILVYQFLKTYIPKDAPTCPEGTSLYIKEANCASGILTLTLKNSGRFGIDAYFIRGSKDANSLATIDLSGSITESAKIFENSIKFSNIENSLSPEDTSNLQTHSFSGTAITGLKKIEIIPIRMQVIDNFEKIVTCSDAKVETTVDNC